MISSVKEVVPDNLEKEYVRWDLDMVTETRNDCEVLADSRDTDRVSSSLNDMEGVGMDLEPVTVMENSSLKEGEDVSSDRLRLLEIETLKEKVRGLLLGEFLETVPSGLMLGAGL